MPSHLFTDENYPQEYYRFILAYKLTDALNIYHNWVGLEDDFNETKMVMMVAYIVGIGISAAITVWMVDRYLKKQASEKEERETKKVLADYEIDGSMDQRT